MPEEWRPPLPSRSREPNANIAYERIHAPKIDDPEATEMTDLRTTQSQLKDGIDHSSLFGDDNAKGRRHRCSFFRQGYRSLFHRDKFHYLQGPYFVSLCAALTAIVTTLINFIFTIWALVTFGAEGGIGTLQKGDCERTKSLNLWIHLAINVLSTALLGASNYSMQYLSSPTRLDIDKAHARRQWLDVGIPSFRNLRRLPREKMIVWLLLGLSSIPLHLLYNSTVIATLSTQQYNVFLVTQDFVEGAPFTVDYSTLYEVQPRDDHQSNLQADEVTDILAKYQRNLSSLERLSNKECIAIYTSSIISKYSDVLLISNYGGAQQSNNSYILSNTAVDSPIVLDPSGAENLRLQWLCAMPVYYDYETCGSNNRPKDPNGNWTIELYPLAGHTLGEDAFLSGDTENPLPINTTEIQYCLSQPVSEECETQFSLGIMIAVLVCNMVKTACMGYIVWMWKSKKSSQVSSSSSEPLMTLGDALASFIAKPDATSRGVSLVGKTRFRGSDPWSEVMAMAGRSAKARWYRAVSMRRWIVCGLL